VYSYYVDGCLEDFKALRVFVAVLMYVSHPHCIVRSHLWRSRMIDSLHLALITHTLYWYLIKNFGDYIQLKIVIWYVSRARRCTSVYQGAGV
jgi:hypothetical protein